MIRLADIRLTERDKIKMGDCFRLGDLVRAKVVRSSSHSSLWPFLASFFFLPLPSSIFGEIGSCLDSSMAMLGG